MYRRCKGCSSLLGKGWQRHDVIGWMSEWTLVCSGPTVRRGCSFHGGCCGPFGPIMLMGSGPHPLYPPRIIILYSKINKYRVIFLLLHLLKIIVLLTQLLILIIIKFIRLVFNYGVTLEGHFENNVKRILN